jgi:Putative rhamnosyl transferase
MRPEAEGGTTHLVLTKYNTVIPGGDPARGLDPTWLQHRLGLFADWPLPAMRAQTRRADGWLVLVDAATDGDYMVRLSDLLAGIGEAVPVAGPLTDQRIGEIVRERLAGRCGALITTRLDSDDAIAADCLERVARAAQGWRGFINPPLGYRVQGRTVVRARDPSGPFLSFVEDLGEAAPLTVFQMPHHEAAFHAPTRQLAGGPAWLQVVHGGNLANAFCGWPTTGARVVADMGLEHLRALRLQGRMPPAARVAAIALEIRREVTWHWRALHNAAARDR